MELKVKFPQNHNKRSRITLVSSVTLKKLHNILNTGLGSI